MTYATIERAEQRVSTLRQHGTWPGVIIRRDGTFALTYDPGTQPEPEDD